jgi:hypothetical protein
MYESNLKSSVDHSALVGAEGVTETTVIFPSTTTEQLEHGLTVSQTLIVVFAINICIATSNCWPTPEYKISMH